MANFFMDATKSKYPKPDPVASFYSAGQLFMDATHQKETYKFMDVPPFSCRETATSHGPQTSHGSFFLHTGKGAQCG
jgi:hypothetical protein